MRFKWGCGLVAIACLEASAWAAPAPAARERRLHLASAEASSYLVNDWNRFQENYLPLYVGDDDPKTAWTLKTEGIGEWLRVHVTPMAGATKVRLKIRNGYQKSDKLWAANSRAQALTVVLLPSKKTVDVSLADKTGWQEIFVEQPAGALEAIELRVAAVYAGKKYDDLCLSDVQVFVTALTPDNPAFEKQRLQKVIDWKKERLDAAKMFATKLGQSLPVASQYVAHDGLAGAGAATERTACGDVLCSMQEQLTRPGKAGGASPGAKLGLTLAGNRFRDMTPVKISTRDKRPVPRIDGVCTPRLGDCIEDPCYGALPLPAQLGYLNAETLVTTEQTGLPAVVDVLDLKPSQCHRQDPTTFAWIARDPPRADGAPGAIRAALLVSCGLVEGREGSYPAASPQLLVYGAEGWLDTAATPRQAATYAWRTDASGPKLVRAQVTAGLEGTASEFEAATAIAAAP